MIKLENVDKYYNYRMDTQVHALKNVNLTINDGEMVAIMGVSGSGKSTMLHILGCLDSQTKGKYFLGEYEVCKYSSNTIAENVICENADGGEEKPQHRKKQAYLTEKVERQLFVVPYLPIEPEVDYTAAQEFEGGDYKR